jgi:hypothetical protein
MTLDKLGELEKAATPGPWATKGPSLPTPDNREGGDYAVMAAGDVVAETFRRVDYGDAGLRPAGDNAALIAASRNALPALIECARAALAVRRTPIVDDDFPERLAALDAALARLAEVQP